MNKKTSFRKARILKYKLAFAVISTVILCACGGSNNSNSNSNNSNSTPNAPTIGNSFYRPPTQEELNEVSTIWHQRDLSAKDVSIVHEHSEGIANVKIYEHRVGANKHYGAVITPINTTKNQLPVELSLDGLDQSNPSITIENNLQYYSGDSVLVVPAFRGRTLHYNGQHFFASGDFCDAFDGATDDAIALLNVVETTTPLANMNKVLATGYSRGGNIALLIAERDPRIHTVIDGAGPVDFYRNEVRERYGDQYQCQFIAHVNEYQSRQRMLASSPLRFDFLPNVKYIYIFHGANDTTVPLWNADEMNRHLLAQGFTVRYFAYNGFGHGDIWNSPNFTNAWNQAHSDFKNGTD